MASPNPPNEQANAVMLISYKTLRTIIGVLGMFLAVILVAGMYFIGKAPYIQSSVSHFYHTRMGDVFVGLLTAISLVLFVYRGPEKSDHWLASAAGILGLTVAFVPTDYHGPTGPADECLFGHAMFHSAGVTQPIHLGAALIFLIILTIFSVWLFPKTHPEQTVPRGSQKWKRNIVFYICGVIMALSLISLIIVFATMDIKEIHASIIVFILEAIALFFFGFSWLVKGEQFIFRDHPRTPVAK